MEKKYKILIVDDAEINRSLLADMLSMQYEILEASNGMEAITLLDKYHTEISLVLLDIIMPVMDGFEVLTVMNKSAWIDSTPVITISSETASNYIDRAYNLGATDYISRPFDERTVQRRVKNTIMLYAKKKLLENMVLQQIIEKEKSNFLMVEILSNIVEFRNGESGLHVLHIRTVTELLLWQLVKMTDKYDLTASKIALIVNASALHDVGKISIPEHILNKPGKLSTEEYEIMKNHSAIGAQILENAPYSQMEELIQIARDICRWHHERYDGKGYPDGLVGEEIPISAQVVALADVYDALTNERVYKPAFSHETALSMILHGECGEFSPLLQKCLMLVGPKIETELKKHAPDKISSTQSQYLTSQLVVNGQASSRTLALLEQERTKYQFFASMSKEIQFEYSEYTDILSFSEWGAKQLGLPELIVHPELNEEMHEVFSKEDYMNLHAHLRRTTPENPVVTRNYLLKVNGQKRWHKFVARPLWAGEEVAGTIGKMLDIHEEYLELNNFREMAAHDSLTQLYNHKAVRELVEMELAKEDGKKYALILFDLDFFKSANDRFGHLFGDKVLKFVAQNITQNIRSEDIAARIGGDEFLIFLSYEDEIETLTERVFQAVTGRYHKFDISVSMGVAVVSKQGRDYEELFLCADKALYAAKKNGKKQYCFYSESIEGYSSVLSPIDDESGGPEAGKKEITYKRNEEQV